VSEQILNGTSAQLGYTVPFKTLQWKIRDRRQIKNRRYTNWTQPRKSKQHKTQQNKTSLV